MEVDPETEREQGDNDHPAAQTGERAEQACAERTDQQDEAEEKNGHGGENRRGVKEKTARNYEKNARLSPRRRERCVRNALSAMDLTQACGRLSLCVTKSPQLCSVRNPKMPNTLRQASRSYL